MIRRSTWLALGAVLGIAGYRRVNRMIQSVAPQSPAVPWTSREPSEGRAAGGLNQYTAPPPGHRPAGGPPRPPGQVSAWHASARGVARAALTLARDVRVGMADYRRARDEYMNRHTDA
jgi:hypothetical protein